LLGVLGDTFVTKELCIGYLMLESLVCGNAVERPTRPIRPLRFEVDPVSGEVRKAGVKLKLGGQPFQVLAIMLERPGDVFTREELQKASGRTRLLTSITI
jgi:DNA-binding response OmpR family regulator